MKSIKSTRGWTGTKLLQFSVLALSGTFLSVPFAFADQINSDITQQPGTTINYERLQIGGATYTLDGAGTTLTTTLPPSLPNYNNVGVIFVGYADGQPTRDAVFNVSNGATVKNPSTFNVATTNAAGIKMGGIANIDGGTLQTFMATIGDTANGTLNILNGGTFTVQQLIQNNRLLMSGNFFGGGATAATGVGVTNVSGKDAKGNASLLGVAGNLYAAVSGSGTVNITNGGIVIVKTQSNLASYGNVYSHFGSGDGGNGIINVSGSGSTLLVSNGGIYIDGPAGDALNISAGAGVSSTNGYLGLTGGSAQVTIDGQGSLWAILGDLQVGNQSDKPTNNESDITITNGGQLRAGSLELGRGSGIGRMTVSGKGSNLTTGSLEIGSQSSPNNFDGHGILTVNHGATANVGGTVSIGVSDKTTGELIVDGAGSKVTGAGDKPDENLNDFFVGGKGKGSITITNGGSVYSSEMTIGDKNAPGSGSVTVDGNNSQLNVGNASFASGLTVNSKGQDGASLIAKNGGKIAIAGNLSMDGYYAKAQIMGSGTILTAKDFNSGSSAIGKDLQFDVNGGATADFSGNFTMDNGSSDGKMTLNIGGNGSRVGVQGQASIGQYGNNNINITNGGELVFNNNVNTNTIANISNQRSTVDINIDGSSSIMSSKENITFGNGSGSTIVNLTNGGTLKTDKLIQLAQNNDSSATLNIGGDATSGAAVAGNIDAASGINFGSGQGTINFNHTSDHYVFSTSLSADPSLLSGSSATINQLSGRTVLTGNNSGYKGTTNISGSSLVIDGKFGASGEGTINIKTGGALYIGDTPNNHDAEHPVDTNAMVANIVNMDKGTTLGGFGKLFGGLNLTEDSHLMGGLDGTAGQFSLTGDLNVANNANFDIHVNEKAATSFISVGGNINFDKDAKANVNILSYNSDASHFGKTYTVLQGSNQLNDSNFQLKIGGVDLPDVDFLQGANGYVDGNKYNVNLGTLSWYGKGRGPNNELMAHGNFTIADGSSFILDSDLTSRKDELKGQTVDKNWDGDTLNKYGKGALVLTGDNHYGHTNIYEGTLVIGDSTTNGENTSDIAINKDATLEFDVNGEMTYAGHLSGEKDGVGTFIQLSKQGTLILTGDSDDFSGKTIVGHGDLQLGNGGITGSLSNSDIEIQKGGNLIFNHSNDITYGKKISGVGGLVQDNKTGTVVLTGDSDQFTGKTTIEAGNLQLGNGGTTGSLTNSDIEIQTNGNLIFDRANDVTYGKQLSGNGGLIQDNKTRTGTVILTGNNDQFTGKTTIEAGNLQLGNGGTTGSLSSSDIEIQKGGNLIFNRSNNVTYGKQLSGNGGLIQDNNTGTVILTGNNDQFAGKTTIEAGNLQLGNSGTTGSLSNSDIEIQKGGNLIFNRSDNVTYNKILSGDGGLIQRNQNNTVVLTADNDQFIGKTTIEAGNLQLGNGSTTGSLDNSDIEIKKGGNLILNHSNDITYNQTLSGDGGILKEGQGRLTLNGKNSNTGLLNLDAGQLFVGDTSDNSSATFGGDVIAHTKSTLGGFGIINGNVEMQSGSNLTPGSSTSVLGKMALGGLTLDGGSNFIYFAKSDGTSSGVNVSSKLGGNGVLQIKDGATLTINGLSSDDWNKAKSDSYTIATADKGVNGKFSNIVNNLAFLNYDIVYNPNSIIANLSRNNTLFGDVGQTFNQINTGAAIDRLATNSAVSNAIITLTKDQARAAYDNLSGEIYGSTRSALLNNSRYLRDAMNRRMLNASRLPSDEPVWFSSWGHGGHISGDGNAVGVDNSGWGISLGLDGEITDKAFAGVLLSYENSNIKNDGTRSSKSDVDSYQIGGYAATELNGIKFRGGLSYSYLDLSTKRHIWVDGLKGKLRSDYNGYQVQLFAEASKDFKLQENATLSPYVNLAQVWLHLDDADEHGSAAALNIDGGTDSVFLTTLGVRGKYKLPTTMPLSLYGDVAWVHNFGDTDGLTTNRFGYNGSRFLIKGVGMGENVALIGTGIETKITKNSTITLGYQGQLGSGESDHSANIEWKLKF